MATTQQYSLRWNNYFRHLTYALDNHRTNDDFVDVSLCCDGRKIKAHKVVLSSCSTYFKEIFKENPHPHPVIIFKFIKYEDLNSIVEFMYQGEVNVHQDALQSFLQTAELLAVQGLTAEEKEKPKAPPTPIIEEHKLIKTIPSTIRTIDTPSVQATTQTIEIPTATILQQVPQLQQQQQQQTQTQAQSGGSQPQQQHHHVQTQIQHIQIHSQPQQVQQATHQLQQQQQAAQQQQTQQSQHLTGAGTNTVTLPVVSTAKKRKITFSDDEDIYTTETVNYVKDEQTIVKTSEMTFLRSEVKMDMPEYIVSEVEDDTEQLTEDTGQQSSQDVTVGGQGVTQYTSEYEILTESELEEKYHQGDSDNTEITIEMSRLLNTGSNSNEEASDETGNAALSSANGSKVDKNSTNADGLSCKLCGRRMQTANALRRHMTSKHSDISGKDYECTQCSKSFKTKWSLSTHNSRFHRDVRATKECECVRMETF